MGISISASLPIATAAATTGGGDGDGGDGGEAKGNAGSLGLSTPLAKEVMGQAKGGWANVAGGVARVEGYSSSMGLGAPLANKVRGRVSMGESKCGGANIAGGVSRVECNSGLSASLANEMGEAKCGGSNIAGSMSWVESYSSAMGLSAPFANEMRGRVSVGEAVCGGANIAGGKSRVESNSGLSTALANMRMTPDGWSDIAGGETWMDCDTKTEAMGLCQGSGKEGGGENKELHAACAFLPTAGVKPQSCSKVWMAAASLYTIQPPA